MSSINIRGKLFDLGQARVMGILNVTPDSFYIGSRTSGSSEIALRIKNMVDAGVDIIDIGGYSSRPGALSIPAELELERITLALEIVKRSFPETIISVDTFRSEIAREVFKKYEVDIINDISGGIADPEMIDFIAEINIPYIMMHMQGSPEVMQNNPFYENVVEDLLKWFSGRIKLFRLKGVKDIIIDPGFGFGKSIDHNYSILSHLTRFKLLGCPIMAGLSRKSMIWKELNESPESDSSLFGTVALDAVAILKGASIIRVHDVSEAVITIKLIQRVLAAD